MTEHVITIPYENKAYDCIIDSGFAFPQDLFALHGKPEPVAVAGDVVS